MTVVRTVADIFTEHTTLEVECIDRMYLNLYVPILQREPGIAHFWQAHRGHRFASGTQMGPMRRAFVTSINRFAEDEGIPLIRFKAGERKDDIAKTYLAAFTGEEGVFLIGKAQEKTRVVRTEKRRNPTTGQTYPWLVMSTAMVNQLLRLLRGPRLRPLLHQDRVLLSLHRQVVDQRP